MKIRRYFEPADFKRSREAFLLHSIDAGLCDLVILQRRSAADANGADNPTTDNNWQAASCTTPRSPNKNVSPAVTRSWYNPGAN
jgi:hypothetical protein